MNLFSFDVGAANVGSLNSPKISLAASPTWSGKMNGRTTLWLGANTPWYRVRLSLGGGIRAAKRTMNSMGVKTTCVVPLLYGVLSLYSTWPWVFWLSLAFNNAAGCVSAQSLKLFTFFGLANNSTMICKLKIFRHYRPHSFPPISTSRDAARRKEKARSLADENCASDTPIRPVADHS